MNTTKPKTFAPKVCIQLMKAVVRKLDVVLTSETTDLAATATQVNFLRRRAESNWDGLVDRIRALDHEMATAEGKGAQTTAHKEQDQLRKFLKECQAWERDVICPLAQQRIEIDLDDGVKTNYPKFEDALAKIS